MTRKQKWLLALLTVIAVALALTWATRRVMPTLGAHILPAGIKAKFGPNPSLTKVWADPKGHTLLMQYGMAAAGAVGLLLCGGLALWLQLGSKPQGGTYGQARWAERKELKALAAGGGVVFGRSRGDLIEKPPAAPGHVLTVGGTGTGKSRGSAIPTLLRWPGAALVIDLKRELWNRTAAARESRGPVYCFDPEMQDADSYDPVAQAGAVDGAMELARYLIPEPKSGDSFWARSAQGLLAAAAFEGAQTGQGLSEVATRLCETPAADLVAQLRGSQFREARLLSTLAADMPEKTLGGVISEMRSHLLTLATDSRIGRATDPRAMRRWDPSVLDGGATVYLRISERQIQQYRGLFTLMLSQVLRHLSSRPDGAPMPVLLLLDELPRLGQVSGLVESLATLRSRNVHMVLIIQSLGQLDAIYGRDERKVIADNCAYKLVLGATDPETQRYFSDLAGQRTVMSHNESTSGSAATLGGTPSNYGRSETGVPLLRPEEWARLTGFVLFSPGRYPAWLQPAWWDKDPELSKLVLDPPRSFRAG